MDDPSDSMIVLAALIWLVLQIAALWRFEGAWHKAAMLSAAVMLLAIAVGIFGASRRMR